MGLDVSEKEKQQIDSSCLWSWSSFGWNTCFSTRAKVENSGHESPNHGADADANADADADAEPEKESCTRPPSEQTIDSVATVLNEQELLSSSALRRFAFNDLKVATRNFRPDSLLGRGGFGCVFKGWVDEHGTTPVKPGTGLTVAVKILNQGGLQGHKEWLAEITYLGQLHHPHLVKLIGYCMEDDQRLLVYEFMQRGSLENHLFRKNAHPLPWTIRMKAALGAAKGLEFLHSENKSAKNGKSSVIYRDFKSSNILLDSEYNAKLSDFGLAKDGPQDDKTHVSTRVMGTYGYAAPEYVMTGHLNSKSDIYSFGVVLLELLTGMRSMDNTRPSGRHNLVEWAYHYLNDKKKILKIIDQRLDGRYCIHGAQKAGDLARQCLNRDPKARPSMTEVVMILEQIQSIKQPANTAPISSPLNGGNKHQR